MAADKFAAPPEGFLSRWSQRKQALRKGETLQEPPVPAQAAEDGLLKQKLPIAGIDTAQNAPDLIVNEPSEPVQPAPELTLQDAQELTPQSDFKPFMQVNVSPQVKNAAMKQLFKDPHFNVMDMMDIYVDDYSKPDPLPPEMLRKMAVTQFLGFWKEEEEAEQAAKKASDEKKAREDAQATHQQTVAQSGAEPQVTTLDTTQESQTAAVDAAASHASHDNHPDLQLQPDDAARRASLVKSIG